MMSKLTDLKKTVKDKSENFRALGKNVWWEVAAYAVRIVCCATPAIIIMYQENSWQKASLGLLASLVIVAIIMILYKPIKQLFSLAPGVLPFGIFIAVSIAFKTMADAFLIIGSCGLFGSILAIPLHYKYLQGLPTNDDMLNVLNQINERLNQKSK